MGAVLGRCSPAGLLWLLCRRADEEKIGRVAAVVFLLSGLVFAVGTYGVLDAQFSFFVTLTMTMFYFAWTEKSRWKQAGFLALAGIGTGLAFLTKGLLGFVLPVLAAVPFLIWQKEWKRILFLPWIPLAAALLVLAPWSIMVHRADPDFWPQFLGVEHFQRFFSGRGANDDRSQPFWFFLPVVIGGCCPGCFSFRRSARLSRPVREAFRNPLLRYAACMGGVWLLFFSVSSGKLATYVLPCFPAYAVLIAWGLVRYAETGKTFREADWALRILFRCLLPALVVLFAVQAFNLFVPGKIPQHYLLFWRGENFFLPVIALMVFLLWIWMAKEAREPVYKSSASALRSVLRRWLTRSPFRTIWCGRSPPVDFLARNAGKFLTSDTLILADDRMAVVAAWTFRRSDIGVYYKKGELAYGLDRPEGEGRFYTKDALAELVRKTERPILVVTGSEKRARESRSPEKSYRRSGDLFLVITDERRETSMKYYALVGVFFIVAYLLPLAGRPMVTPDEFRYAEIPREMIDRGDYVTPHLVNMRYFEKPVMGYWMTAGCFKVFGRECFCAASPGCARGRARRAARCAADSADSA